MLEKKEELIVALMLRMLASFTREDIKALGLDCLENTAAASAVRLADLIIKKQKREEASNG